MQAKDQTKLLKFGFIIIRKQLNPHIIKAKTCVRHEWFTLENNFPTAAALERRMKELLADEKTVED